MLLDDKGRRDRRGRSRSPRPRDDSRHEQRGRDREGRIPTDNIVYES